MSAWPSRTRRARSPPRWGPFATSHEPCGRESLARWRIAGWTEFVIGLPRRLDGSEGEAAAAARTFAAELARRTAAKIELWDERFTTTIAERALIESGVRRKRRREVIDSVAAAVLLQNWLDARRIAASRTSP